MVGQAVPCYLFPFGARSAVVAVWVNGNTAAWCKFAPHFDIFWIHEFDKIFHNDIDTVFVKIPMIAETEQIQFQRLTFYHPFSRYVRDINGSKIRLTCHWAQAGKFRTVEFYEIIIVWMFVWECFQYFRCIIAGLYCFLTTQLGHSLQFFGRTT